MATYRVTNTSGGRLAVPPPLAIVLGAGRTATLEATSLDSSSLQSLMDRNLIAIARVTDGGLGEAAEVANFGLIGAASKTMIGTIGAPVVLGAGQTMTLTHNLGVKASKVNVYDSVGANFTAAADITVAQTASTVTVTSTAGGSFVVVVSFAPPVTNNLGGALAQNDARVVVA